MPNKMLKGKRTSGWSERGSNMDESTRPTEDYSYAERTSTFNAIGLIVDNSFDSSVSSTCSQLVGVTSLTSISGINPTSPIKRVDSLPGEEGKTLDDRDEIPRMIVELKEVSFQSSCRFGEA